MRHALQKKKFMPGIANLVRKMHVAGGAGVQILKKNYCFATGSNSFLKYVSIHGLMPF